MNSKMKIEINKPISFNRTFIVTLMLMIAFYANMIYCDIPVHCKREQIEGKWIFRIEDKSFNADLANPQTTCGHSFPDKIEETVGDINFKFQSYKEVEVILSKDYKIYDSNNIEVVGSWTPVYDEAFVAYYKSSVFTAFMKYYVKKGVSMKAPEKEKFESNCDKTMIGWYIPDEKKNDKNWRCFFGFKSIVKREFSSNRFMSYMDSNDIRSVNAENGDDTGSRSNTQSFVEVSNENNMGLNLNYDQAELVDELNSMNLSWKADIHEEFKGLSFFQLKDKLGLKHKSRFTVNSNSGVNSNNNSNNSDENSNVYESLNLFGNMNIPVGSHNNGGVDTMLENLSSQSNSDTANANLNSNINSNNPTPILKNGPININDLDQKSETFSTVINKLNESVSKIDLQNTQNPQNQIPISLDNKNIENKPEPNINLNLNLNTQINPGNPENSDISVEEDSQNVTDFKTISKYANSELSDIDINKLPKNWDWRNVGGQNFVPAPRRQSNCGSCYIFSLVSSLEARLRILTNNKDKTEFSRQFPLACSFYTEGCQGGYPFLVAKFFNEFEIIPDSCMPYNPRNVKCSNRCDYTQNPKKYFVSRYEYLGGFYGATNEIEIIKELRARGPMPGNMSVPWTFSYYKSGIFAENSLKKNTGKFSKATMFNENLSWKSVDHSILLVGYGEENGIKYWIGMNTWGTQWGEDGYFRILRGENNCNIETMGDAARISFKDRYRDRDE